MKKILTIILLGLLISILLNFYYIKKFDNYDPTVSSQNQHFMIKSDPEKFWLRAHNLKAQLINGKNFFETGDEYRIPYLPSKIIYLFSLITNDKFYDQENLTIIKESYNGKFQERKIALDNKKVFFLIFQSFFYYLSLFFLYSKIRNRIDANSSLYLILFLSLEPTIMLFHSSFWSESIFFTLLIFLIALVFENKIANIRNLIIGLLLGLLFLQRSIAIYYFVILIIYYICIFKRSSLRPIFFTLLGYLMVVLFIGFHNYKRSDNFYVQPTQAKDGFYVYLVPMILSSSKKISTNEVKTILNNDLNEWIVKNDINLENESARLIYYNYLQKKSFQIIIKNPFITFKLIFKKTLHYFVLDPLRHVHYFYKFDLRKQNSFYKTELADNMVIPRIVYSFLIYSIILIGFISVIKKKENIMFAIFLLISIIYFTLVTSWIGNTRYNTPNLIFLSFFIGYGVKTILNFIKNKKNEYNKR